MFIINNYTHKSKPLLTMEEYQTVLSNISLISNEYFNDKPTFTKNSVKVYYYDEVVLGTSVNANQWHSIFIEIDAPNNIRAQQKKSWLRHKLVPDTYLNLKQIKRDLLEMFKATFASNVFLGEENHCIILKEAYVDEESDKNLERFFRIVPCFTYTNESGEKGVLYHNNNFRVVQIEYPRLSAKNFVIKNTQTDGVYEEMVIIFKNILKKEKNVNFIPFEVAETMVYNVPNEMLKEITVDNILNCIEFLQKKGIHNLLAIDKQSYAFRDQYRSLSSMFSVHFLSQVKKHIKKNI